MQIMATPASPATMRVKGRCGSVFSIAISVYCFRSMSDMAISRQLAVFFRYVHLPEIDCEGQP